MLKMIIAFMLGGIFGVFMMCCFSLASEADKRNIPDSVDKEGRV